MRRVKAHEQIIYRSISHLSQLPEVKQAQEESILVFWYHLSGHTKVKEV